MVLLYFKECQVRPLSVPWEIFECHLDCMTIREFYDAILLPKIIRVSPELPLVPVIVQFGKYLKIIVVLEDNEVELISSKTRNKLHVGKYHHLLRSKLHTHLLSYCEKQEVLWKPDEINTIGVNFLRSVCDVMWYIDGHHHVFTNRGCPIPDVFDQFQGFNTPHLSKHRKRTTSNMTCNELEAYSSKLYGVLQSSKDICTCVYCTNTYCI